MSTRRVYAIFLRQIFLLRRNATRFSNIFLWPVLDVLLWGFIATYLDRVGKSGFSFLTVFLGAIILWTFLVSVQQGIIRSFFEDMWSRNFMNLFASPLRVSEYVVGLVVTGIMTSFSALALLLLLAWLLFAYHISSLGLLLVPFLGIIFVFGVALGIFTAAIVLRFGPAAEWLAWPIPFILGPFAGIFYPISSLPLSLQPVAKIIPVSYVFEGMRAALATGTFSTAQLALGFGLAFVYLTLAAVFFAYIFRAVLRNGLLTRFSAESF